MHKSNVAARVIYATPALHPTHWLIYAQAEIEKLNGARLTLESQIIALEGTVTNADTVAAMKSGATAMKHARADVDADAVGDLMDDIQEEMATADEISAAISAPGGDLLGDDELLDELNELDEQAAG